MTISEQRVYIQDIKRLRDQARTLPGERVRQRVIAGIYAMPLEALRAQVLAELDRQIADELANGLAMSYQPALPGLATA